MKVKRRQMEVFGAYLPSRAVIWFVVMFVEAGSTLAVLE